MSLLDNLPSLPFFGKKDQDQEYFFALNIDSSLLTGSLWTVEHKHLKILNTSQLQYESEEDLFAAATQVLDEVLGDFVFEPTKVLFGVPDTWLQDDNLKPEYSKLLSHLVKELDLEPLAYVSANYAISYLLHKQTGVPLTAILVNVGDPLMLTVVKAGKIVGTKTLKRTQNLPQDIEKALASLQDIEVLPSRLLLYGPDHMSSKMDKFKDDLQGFNWMSTLPFLHLPKVEALAEGVEILAVCFAGGAENTPDLKLSAHALPPKQPTKHTLSQGLRVKGKGESKKNDLEKEDREEISQIEEGEETGEEVDFVAGDIEDREKGKGKSEKDKEEDEVEETEEFGDRFAVVENDLRQAERGLAKKVSAVLTTFASLVPARFTGAKHGHGRASPNIRLLAPIILFILFLIGGFIFLPKAEVTVYVDPKILENEAEVVADPAVTAVDEAAKKIPAKVVEVDVVGSGQSPATGKKQIGEKAKGKVIVYNATSKSVNLSKGTILSDDKGQKFVLDTAVSIASKSASAADPPSRSDAVDASASEIGPDGNIAAGRDLSVTGFGKADVVAKVDQTFAGGISKEVTVVSSEDQKKLLASVTSDLRKKAREELQAELGEGEKILEEALTEGTIKPQYSKAVGDQSSEVSLSLSVKYKGTAYNENDLKTIVAKLVQTTVPDGFMLNLQDAQTQADVVRKEKDNRLIFKAKFKARLMPQIDTASIIKEIKGKTPSEVAEIVRKNESVVSSDIKIRPSLPSALSRMPILERNISVEVTTK